MVTGVVAVGDSITVGATRDVGTLPCRSYAAWVAETLGEPVTIHARGGASSGEVVNSLLPEVAGRYHLALTCVGVNDVIRSGRFNPDALAANLAVILTDLRQHAERVAVLTISETTGSVPTLWAYGPTRRRRIAEANRVICRVSAEHGVEVVTVPALHGRHVLWADRIHPTARGQVEIAEAVVQQLGLPGSPHALAADRIRPPGLRWDMEYAWWLTKNIVRVPPRRAVGTMLRAVGRSGQTDGEHDQRPQGKAVQQPVGDAAH